MVKCAVRRVVSRPVVDRYLSHEPERPFDVMNLDAVIRGDCVDLVPERGTFPQRGGRNGEVEFGRAGIGSGEGNA